MSTFNKDDVVGAGCPPIQYDSYTLAVKDVKFGESKSSGNPMTTLICEIIEPEEKECSDGKTYRIAGTEVRYYLTYTENAIGRVFKALEKLDVLDKEFPYTDEEGNDQVAIINSNSLDPHNVPTEPFKGLIFTALLWSTERIERLRQTEEQKKAGEQGTPITRKDGSQIKLGWEIAAPLDKIDELLDRTEQPY